MSDVEQESSGTAEEQQEATVEVTSEQEPEPATPEPETPEVKEEEQPEAAEQPTPPAEEPKEEPQPEEEKPEAEEQTPDAAEPEEKPEDKPEEESTAVVQEEAPPPQSGGDGEGVTEQKEETATEPEQPPPTKEDEAEIQPAAAPESTTATTEEEAKEEPAPEVKETVAVAEPAGEVKEKPKRPLRNKVRSTVPTEGVDLDMGDGPLEGADPITFGQLFKITLEKYADTPALKWKVQEGEGEEAKMVWKMATFAEYYKSCIDAAKSLIKLGLEDNHGVGIIGFNSPEWVIANNAAIFAGGLSAGIYATNGPDACHFVLEDSKSNVVVVENQKQLDKILQVRDRLPHLKAIVQYKGKLSQAYDNVYDWEQFMELGKDMDDGVIEDKIKAQKPEQCALLIYTSGTTGNPKAVMLSHDNLTWTGKSLYETLGEDYVLNFGGERVVSYLPLSHIAAQMEDIYLCIYGAATLYFAQPDALKGSLLQTLLDVRPTLFFAVPRVWEKFQERMQAVAAEVTGIKKVLGRWAKGVAFQGNSNIQNKRGVPWTFNIANSLVLKKVHNRIGLDCLKLSMSGAAPIHRNTIEYFMGINIPVLELYGMSETSGPHSFNLIKKWRLGSVGHSMKGTHLKIDQPDENGEGEICMRGRHIFMGYLNNEEKTKEAIDDEGWLHSGDIGKVDKDGFIFITGRIKELIITAGGENMAPVPIEDRIKAEVPFLSNVMLIGDKKKFISCLVTLKCEMDPDTGEPKDELLPEAKALIAKLGCSYTKVSEVVASKDEKVYSEITAGLGRANQHAISHAQKVQKFTLLEKDFSMPGGEIGPTLKLKRHVVVKKFAAQIDAMYEVTEQVAKV